MSASALARPVLAGRGFLPIVIGLALAFALLRALGTLGPASLRGLLPLGFVLMALTPWALLSPAGRREIGLRRPQGRGVWLPALGSGAAASLLCFGLGWALFDRGADHWFVTTAQAFRASVPLQASTPVLFLMFMLPAISFSPVGEEIFFRGLLQRSLETRWSARTSTWIECGFFGLVHLCHHGLVLGAAGWTLRPLSAPLWVLLMMLTARLFAALRERSGSLYPAMVAHASFNLTMSLCIFGLLWPPGG